MKSQQNKVYSLAELTRDTDVVIKGDPECLIKGVCTINQPQPGHITFLVNSLYKKYLPATEATAVILSANDADECPVTAVISPNPYFTYAHIASFFETKTQPKPGIHSSAVIGADCQIHESASISPLCVIGDGVKIAANVTLGSGCVIGEYSEIGEGTRVDANVTVYHQISIGKQVVILSGTVIGSDGFGNAKHKGAWHKVPQLGRVIIGDHVEIGANCAIDRGAIGDTIIEKGVRLDNHIQVGHNVFIGENTAIAGCVGIAGSAVIGKNCLIAGCAGINGHITIADNVVITGMTIVSKSIREAGIYSSGVGGLVTNLEWRKNSARINRLEHLIQRVKNLESVVGDFIEERKTT